MVVSHQVCCSYLVRSSRSVAPVYLSGTNFTVESQNLLSLTSRSVVTTLFLLKTTILLAVRYPLWLLLLTLHHSCPNPKLLRPWMKVILQLVSKDPPSVHHPQSSPPPSIYLLFSHSSPWSMTLKLTSIFVTYNSRSLVKKLSNFQSYV